MRLPSAQPLQPDSPSLSNTATTGTAIVIKGLEHSNEPSAELGNHLSWRATDLQWYCRFVWVLNTSMPALLSSNGPLLSLFTCYSRDTSA